LPVLEGVAGFDEAEEALLRFVVFGATAGNSRPESATGEEEANGGESPAADLHAFQAQAERTQ
jgi:hypothetical protein